jgi:hypothetical protein
MAQLDEARQILKDLGFPASQSNDRSGRVLLSLAQLDLSRTWQQASNPRIGVRAILDWMRTELNFNIAENSRETVRRQTLHQFLEAGLVIYNEDDANRPTNSSLNNYKLTEPALQVLHAFGTSSYKKTLEKYLENAPALASKYRAERKLSRIPVTMPGGINITLGAGGQNVLIKAMLLDFCEYFVPGGEVLYIGDADNKLVHFNESKLLELGIKVEEHGKLPDLIVYQESKNWLFLMEAASTHGPVDSKRQSELQHIFSGSLAGIVYVSCFPDRNVMRKFLGELAWETEVWLASDPTHMIHLNGDRFMGPYET